PVPSIEETLAEARTAYEAQNYGNAFALFQQAAEQGSAEAQFRLGTMYLEGRGVAPDTTEAETWLRRADQQGYADAEQALAQLEETVTDQRADETDTTEAPESAAETDTDDTDIAPPPSPDEEGEPKVYFFVDRMPELIGGIRAIHEKIRYPERARRRGVEGSATVTFVVDEQGQVVDLVVKERDGLGFDEEALRVVRQARYRPGRHRGKAVKVQQTLTITFKLN
ncbi:MAG: TonB family protein, partial [Rhodothermales bacterium]